MVDAAAGGSHDGNPATTTRGAAASGGELDRRFIFATAVLSFALGWLGAATMPLTDPDEGRYAEIAREMAAGGDWLIPHIFGIPYLEKPPLLFWLTAASFQLFGTSEQAARVAPLAAASLGVLLAGLFARSMFSARAGVLSSVVLALSGLYWVLGRALVVDTLFAVALAAALFAYACFREQSSRPWHAVAFWLALALAVLSKGPAAIAIAAVVIGVDALIERTWHPLRRPIFACASLGFFILALPWFARVRARQPDFLAFYFWKEHLQRIGGSEHAEPILFFVPWLLIGLLPWTPLAITLLPDWWTEMRRRSAEGSRVRFLLVWSAAVFVLFSLSRGKLITYILPMFPPLAVLIGHALDRAIERRATERAAALAFAATGVMFGLGLVAVAGTWILGESALGPAASIGLVVPLAAGAVVLIVWRNEAFVRLLGALVAATSALFVALTVAAPVLGRSFTAKPLIERLELDLGPEDRYLMWGKYLPSAAFHLERPPLFLGLRPELRYGASLMEEVPNVARDGADLRRQTEGRRVFVLTDNRKKREAELRILLGNVRMLARTQTATLWLRP